MYFDGSFSQKKHCKAAEVNLREALEMKFMWTIHIYRDVECNMPLRLCNRRNHVIDSHRDTQNMLTC